MSQYYKKFNKTEYKNCKDAIVKTRAYYIKILDAEENELLIYKYQMFISKLRDWLNKLENKKPKRKKKKHVKKTA